MTPKIKQADVSSDLIGALVGKRIKIEGFNGTFRGLKFNDAGESDEPVDTKDLEVIQTCWPEAKIEAIEPEGE